MYHLLFRRVCWYRRCLGGPISSSLPPITSSPFPWGTAFVKRIIGPSPWFHYVLLQSLVFPILFQSCLLFQTKNWQPVIVPNPVTSSSIFLVYYSGWDVLPQTRCTGLSCVNIRPISLDCVKQPLPNFLSTLPTFISSSSTSTYTPLS